MGKVNNINTMSNNGPNFSKERNRLNRIVGQVEGIKKMISERRECTSILSQLRAVRSAVHSIEANILQTYMEYCIDESFLTDSEEDRLGKIEEVRELYTKYSK